MIVYAFFASVLFAAGTAAALDVAPPGPFTAQGVLALAKGSLGVNCRAIFRGVIGHDGELRIDTVDFGRQPHRCRYLTAVGLPWRGRPEGATRLRIPAIAVDVRVPLVGGMCGPASVVAEWQAQVSAVRFAAQTLTPDCTLDGTVATTPALVVRP